MSTSAVRVLILGDEGVGKTTIIKTLVSESFPQQVPHVTPPSVIPPELNHGCKLTIVDSHISRDQLDGTLYDELNSADSVIVVYDISREETLTRVVQYWIPLIIQQTQCPILVVGNKADLQQSSTTIQEYEENILPGLREFKQVELVAE